MNFRILLSIAALLLTIPYAHAQNIYSSPYSVYGLGMPLTRTSAMNRGMAGTGIGIQDEFNLNHANPASYGSIMSPVTHLYEIGFYMESNRLQTSKMSDSRSTGGLSNISSWFKFKPRWAATVGLSPYSSVSYNISTQRALGASATEVNYNYEGSGNISSVYFGNSFRVTKHLSLGLTASYLFGSIVKNESIDISSGPLTLENKIAAHKFDVDFGMQYKLKIANRSLVIGAIYNNGVKMKGKQTGALYDASADTLNQTNGETVTYRIPRSAGLGVGLHSKRSIIATDLRYTNWTQAEFSNQKLSFRDTWRFSAGYLYRGNPNAESYLGLISLRSGFYVQPYQLNLKGNNFAVWGASVGLSMPAFDNKSSINLTYSIDRLGTTQDGLISQKVGKIMVDIVIRDLWGIKRKFD